MKAVILVIITFWLFNKCAADKKYCWYFEGGYPIYFICRSYEDCCDTECCVRALSIQKIWYFWLLLLLAILFCCGVGFLFRRRIYASAIPEEATFDVSFTSHPVSATGQYLAYYESFDMYIPKHMLLPNLKSCIDGALFFYVPPAGLHDTDLNSYRGPQGLLFSPPYPGQPHALHLSVPYAAPPAYSSQPPPSYEQAVKDSQKR
ncbi:WW domain binding protein VOPP1 [Alosa pseudoharengus]|uniref:WW domain binding protein VOPP1 n=1 Tax=Alosa pseudoharengus TaxID=34774 RepID=UPI003F8A90C6